MFLCRHRVICSADLWSAYDVVCNSNTTIFQNRNHTHQVLNEETLLDGFSAATQNDPTIADPQDRFSLLCQNDSFVSQQKLSFEAEREREREREREMRVPTTQPCRMIE